jgi:oligopeptide/dipeptide ABC transporter ATP-binding protein
MSEPHLLEVVDLAKHFPIRKGVLGKLTGHVHAVDGVSFTIDAGETLGLVGESGCGKSTVGRTVLRLLDPTSGSIRVAGADITHLANKALRPFRRKMQIIFQDPFSSLDPRMTAAEIVGELLTVHEDLPKAEVDARVADLFARVGLRQDQMRNYPHEFSGGQRQRLGIARALSLNPELIICDEPVSALDVSIQAQVVNLLIDLQQELGLAYLFVAHDLAVVEHISHRVAVMYLGRIVEFADRDEIFRNAQHPYTESLLAAVPVPDPSAQQRERILEGDVPSPISRPSGCHFHTRCPYATERCREEDPALHEVASRHLVACHLR